MFGYIRVLESELKIKDYGIYRGVYCGLCKTMNRNTGRMSPLTLTYDFVLLALVRSGINGEGFTVRPGKCIAHPFKKRPIAHENEALRFCSAISAVLTYYKLLDDKNDKDTKKRLVVKATLRTAKRNMKKAFRRFPEYDLKSLAQRVEASLSSLTELENNHCTSPDACADVFGKLLADCFSHAINDEGKKNSCYELGFRVGRWIYLIDLCDDFSKDLKSGAFNPLVASGFTELPEILIKGTLMRESSLAYKALSELNIGYDDIYSICENILCHGMKNAMDKIFEKYQNNDKKLEGTT